MPGWIYGHRAQVVDSRFIRISGGTVATKVADEEGHSANQQVYLFDTRTLRWSS